MPQILPFQSYISQSSQAETSFKTIEVKYGNGYSQRAGDGYNSNSSTWTVDWGMLNETIFSTILAALDLAGGVDYFTWTAPGDASQKKWIVRKYTRRALSGNIYEVSATLEQVFDL
jgi:phage-related protein